MMQSPAASPRPQTGGPFLAWQRLPAPCLDMWGLVLKKHRWRLLQCDLTISPQPPPCPPLGLLPEPHRARVKGVSSAHHEEVGGHPVAPSDVASSSGLAIRGRYRRAPRTQYVLRTNVPRYVTIVPLEVSVHFLA